MTNRRWLSEDIITILDNSSGLTCEQIHERLDVPMTTVYDRLVKMERQGIIYPNKDFASKPTNKGRSRVLWRLWKLGKRKTSDMSMSA